MWHHHLVINTRKEYGVINYFNVVQNKEFDNFVEISQYKMRSAETHAIKMAKRDCAIVYPVATVGVDV